MLFLLIPEEMDNRTTSAQWRIHVPRPLPLTRVKLKFIVNLERIYYAK